MIDEINRKIGELQAEKDRIREEDDRRRKEAEEAAACEQSEAIRDLVSAYNECERTRLAMLRDIFDTVIQSEGYRRVRFSHGGVWSNFPHPTNDKRAVELARERWVDGDSRLILEANAGKALAAFKPPTSVVEYRAKRREPRPEFRGSPALAQRRDLD